MLPCATTVKLCGPCALRRCVRCEGGNRCDRRDRCNRCDRRDRCNRCVRWCGAIVWDHGGGVVRVGPTGYQQQRDRGESSDGADPRTFRTACTLRTHRTFYPLIRVY
jgi:hypothetical protein